METNDSEVIIEIKRNFSVGVNCASIMLFFKAASIFEWLICFMVVLACIVAIRRLLWKKRHIKKIRGMRRCMCGECKCSLCWIEMDPQHAITLLLPHKYQVPLSK